MKRIASLFMIVVMLCSFSIVANADSTGEMTFTIATDATEITPGSKVNVTITVSANSGLMSTGFSLKYDTGVFSKAKASGIMTAGEDPAGTLNFGWSTTSALEDETEMAKITFQVASEPVATQSKLFIFEIDRNMNHSYSPSCGWEDNDDIYVDLDKVTVNDTITLKAPGGEFAVKAKLDANGKVVVTAENVGENAGTVYVATYNEGVLVDCEVKALADIADGWTVENLDGEAANAQIYVWNDQNVPLFDNVITVSAE